MKIEILFQTTREKVSEMAKAESDLCERVNEMGAKEAFELGFRNGFVMALNTLHETNIRVEEDFIQTIKKKKEDKKNERHGGHPWPECQKFCRHYVAGKNSMFCHDCCGSDDWFEAKGGKTSRD